MKDTLRLKILWAWIKIRANSFIKTLVKNMNWKINKGALNIITRQKNATPHFKEHCTKIDISLVIIRFFFTQTNLSFLNITHYLLTYWIVFATVYLHSYFLIFTFILRILRFIQCLYTFFIKTIKVLIRFNVLFVRFSSTKYVLLCLIFHEKTLPVNMDCC